LSKPTPDHHDAELLIQVYDLRREATLRASRQAILRDFWPKAWADVEAVTKPEHPLNVPYRQTGTYWEMIYSFVRHGIVHPEFWLENNGEGLYLFVKVEPYLAQIRASNPVAFRNAEWVARECPDGRPIYERIKARVATMAAARAPQSRPTSPSR
jgi:hypothetical protein